MSGDKSYPTTGLTPSNLFEIQTDKVFGNYKNFSKGICHFYARISYYCKYGGGVEYDGSYED